MNIHFVLRQTACLALPPCGHVSALLRVSCIAILLSQVPLYLCLGLETDVLYPVNGSQLEIILVSVAEPALPRILCEVSPVFLDLPVVACQTRYLSGIGGLDRMNGCSET
jgi:hypothetical protein